MQNILLVLLGVCIGNMMGVVVMCLFYAPKPPLPKIVIVYIPKSIPESTPESV